MTGDDQAPKTLAADYQELRARAAQGDREALRQIHDLHRRRVRFVPKERADEPGGSCIIDDFDRWRSEGGLDKPIRDGRS